MEDHVKEALEIVKVQAAVRNMTEEEINSMIKTLASGIQEVSRTAEVQQKEDQKAPVDPVRAIREKSIVCLECGRSFRVLTKKHLAKHDLTQEEYKSKWGYKKNASLVAKALARNRRKKMQEMELWKKREIKMPRR